MKKIYLLFFISFIGKLILAQTVTVLDKTSLQPLANVAVFSNNPKVSTITNAKGIADISGFRNSDVITLRCVGFQEIFYSYKQIESMQFTILMIEKPYSLDEVVISASRFEEKRVDVPNQIQVLKPKEIEFDNQPTTAEMLQNSGNILVQKSQLGGGSPIIRGFEANKVLIVVDGVRMNNAIFRGGHLQNVLSLDQSILDKTEIVFGPGSVVYGSDALGGVMHFYTKNPMLSENGEKPNIAVNAYARYSTAYNEETGHVDFNFGGKKLASFTSFSYSKFGDLRQGNERNPFYGDWGKSLYYAGRIAGKDTMLRNDNVNIQKKSGYQQYDFLQKFLFQQSKKVSHLVNFQYSTTSDINRYDRLTEMSSGGTLKSAQWYYGPQKRLFATYSLNLSADKGIYNQARVILGYQNIEESRHNRNFGSSKLNHRIEKVDVLTINADFSKEIKKNELRYGFEATYNKVNSTANQEIITTGEINPLDTRYPDGGSTMRTLALYFTHTLEISQKVIFSDGLRYSNIYLNSKFNDKTFFPFPFDEVTQKSGALNGDLGLIYMPGYDWRFSILGSTGFRAPNVDDMSKVFESVPGTVIVPNPDLKPEYTYNGEMSISKVIASKVRIEGIGFYTIYNNAITTERATFNGQDSILYEGELSQVTSSKNANEAFIYGFSGNITAEITDAFSIASTLNYTYGRIKTDSVDYPLDHIPPLFGKTSLILNLKKFKGEFFALYNGWKRIKDFNMSGEDNQQYATEFGMPSWCTLNLRTAYQINKNLQIQVDLENILNQNYRVFASGISGPGRDFRITLRGRF